MNIDYELGIIIVTIGLTIIGAKIIGEMQFQRYKKITLKNFLNMNLLKKIGKKNWK